MGYRRPTQPCGAEREAIIKKAVKVFKSNYPEMTAKILYTRFKWSGIGEDAFRVALREEGFNLKKLATDNHCWSTTHHQRIRK